MTLNERLWRPVPVQDPNDFGTFIRRLWTTDSETGERVWPRVDLSRQWVPDNAVRHGTPGWLIDTGVMNQLADYGVATRIGDPWIYEDELSPITRVANMPAQVVVGLNLPDSQMAERGGYGGPTVGAVLNVAHTFSDALFGGTVVTEVRFDERVTFDMITITKPQVTTVMGMVDPIIEPEFQVRDDGLVTLNWYW